MLRKQGKSRWVVAALAAAVVLGFGAMTWSSSPVEATPQNITGGYLDWGVKASFRNYILNGPANGTITLSEGALQNGDGTFRFPAVATGSYDGETDRTTSSFSGKVFFTGHSGALEMEITDIRVQITGTTGLLIADVVSRGLAPPALPVAYPDVEFAVLDLTSVPANETGQTVSWASIPAALTSAGGPAFAGFYPAGEILDPVSPTLNLGPIGDLTWKISQHAWTSSSLAPAHATGAPAVKHIDNGFIWPTFDVVSYDRVTGATELAFDGSVTIGNVNQGGYRIMFDNPRIIIDDSHNGEIRADVSYCANTGACAGPWVGPAPDVTLTTFITNPGGITDIGGHVSWTFTPEYSSVGNQFDQELLDVLAPAVPSLLGHFQNTGSGSDPNKPPAPISVQFYHSCELDTDCDGFLNAVDNCPTVLNPEQTDSDAGMGLGNGPTLPGDDMTRPNTDALGDACDQDSDNDGRADPDELAGTGCGAVVTEVSNDIAYADGDPPSWDTDGDAVPDGVECAVGTDPTVNLSSDRTACTTFAGGGDGDGDGLQNAWEICKWGTSAGSTNTDDDGLGDCVEVMDVNGNGAVNAVDSTQVFQHFFGVIVSGNPFVGDLASMDVNGNGQINAIDATYILQAFFAVNPCL